MGRKPLPKPCFLDSCDYLGYVYGERRWRTRKPRWFYTWDALHGEIEAFNARGRHVAVLDAVTGELVGKAVEGRRINV